LPQPEGPSKQVTCPGKIRSETSSTTVREPNRRIRFLISSRAVSVVTMSLSDRYPEQKKYALALAVSYHRGKAGKDRLYQHALCAK
jgi:hypothetical protein